MCLAATLVGCGGVSKVDKMQAQITEVLNQLTELRKNQAGMSVTVEDLETRLFLVQDDLDTMRPNNRRRAYTQIPEGLPTKTLSPRRPAPAPVASKPAPVFDCLNDAGERVPCKNVIATAPVARVAPPAPAAPVAKAAGKPVTTADRDAVGLYKDSYQHVKANRYEQAIDGFNKFIERFPNHGYADNAVYWMGECYYDRALWVKAMQTFQQVIQAYPLGNKAPDAMLKLGLCYIQLRNVIQAREVLQQVTEIYPKSPVAKIALQRLERLQ